MNRKHITKWFYWFTFAVAVIAVYKILDNFTSIMSFLGSLVSLLMPFILAIIIAYLFYVPSRKLEGFYRKIKINKKVARTLSVFTVYIIAILLIILLVKCVIPPISESVRDLGTALPDYYNKASEMLEEAKDNDILQNIDIDSNIEKIKDFDISTILSFDNIIEYINKAIGAAGVIFNFFVMIIVSIYILLERGEIREFFIRLIKSLFEK